MKKQHLFLLIIVLSAQVSHASGLCKRFVPYYSAGLSDSYNGFEQMHSFSAVQIVAQVPNLDLQVAEKVYKSGFAHGKKIREDGQKLTEELAKNYVSTFISTCNQAVEDTESIYSEDKEQGAGSMQKPAQQETPQGETVAVPEVIDEEDNELYDEQSDNQTGMEKIGETQEP